MLIYGYNQRNKMIKGGVGIVRQKIRLDTMTDIQRFVETVSRINEPVYLEDNTGYKVTAKSLLFASAAKMEWSTIYCSCNKDISGSILPWIV